MAHLRNRQLSELNAKLLAFDPIIGIFGHRQVGKTTLTSALAKTYYTLDNEDTLGIIRKGPQKFLEKQTDFPVVLDECQLEPRLFPALKEYIRTHKKPGQFILTGSVRFSSRKAIRESLAGRLSQVELFPLIISEILEIPLSEALPRLLKMGSFSESSLSFLRHGKELSSIEKGMENYLKFGGLPGLCFQREERLRRERLTSLHQLILDRDLRLVVETKLSFETLHRWLRWIASRAWEPYNASEARRALGLSHVTQKNLLYGLESIFLIRRVPLEFRKGELIFLEDQYEQRALSLQNNSRENQMLEAIFRNGRAQFHYRMGEPVTISSFWKTSGARIPLVFSSEMGTLGILIMDEGDHPSLSQKRSADSFLREYPNGKILFLNPDVQSKEARKPRILENRILMCSAAAVV